MFRTLATFALLAATAAPAFAHVGHPGGSLQSGLLHPLSGLDHLLAMLAVGLWATQKGGRALWLWPTAFVTVMLLGGALGMAGLWVPLVEPGILTSLLVLGLLLAFTARPSDAAGAAIIAAFALLHGHAHGAEAGGADWLSYAAGFVLATAGLHLLGISAGIASSSLAAPWVVRAAGALTAAAGFGLALAG